MRMGALILALALVVMASAVMADPVGAAIDANADKGSYTPSTTEGNISVTGGHVYSVDLSVEDAADDWAGIYGTITQTLVLGDSAGAKFFDWSVSPSGRVIITYHNDIDWTTWTAYTAASDMATDLSNEIGWSSTDETVDATYDGTGDCGHGNTLQALVYGDYTDADTTVGKEWPVCAYQLKDTTGSNNRVVYVSPVYDSGLAYDGSSADYEAIVAAPSGGSQTVFFFKE